MIYINFDFFKSISKSYSKLGFVREEFTYVRMKLLKFISTIYSTKFKNGLFSEIFNCINGLKQGVYIDYNDYDTISYGILNYYKNNLKHGREITYFTDELMIHNYRYGISHGHHIEYCLDGSTAASGYFINNKKHGKCIEYRNSLTWRMGHYKFGKPHGEFIESFNGSQSRVIFVKGKCITNPDKNYNF